MPGSGGSSRRDHACVSEIKDMAPHFNPVTLISFGMVLAVTLQICATDGILKVYANIQGSYVSAMA
jgi:hypothetical protein